MKNFIKNHATLLVRKGLSRVPARKKLPLKYWLHSLDNSLEAELKCLDRLTTQRQVAIDVGANVGYFSYRMSQLFSDVYAFEINDEITQDLVAYNPGNIKIEHQGLSSQESSATLYTPLVDGHPLNAWSSLTPGNYPGTQEHREKAVTISRLDAFNISPVFLN